MLKREFRVRNVMTVVLSFTVLVVFSALVQAQGVSGRVLAVVVGPAAAHLDPSPSSPVVGTLAVGTRVTAEQLREGWYRVRLPKPDSAPAAVYGWIPVSMLAPVAESELLQPPAGGPPADESVAGVLQDLRAQRDRLDRAIQALQTAPEAEPLRARRAKIDVAIKALEETGAGSPPASTNVTYTPVPSTTTAPRGLAETPKTGVERQGFLIGFSIGGGAIDCADCDSLSGVAADFHIGGMLNEKVALMYDGSAVASGDPAVTVSVGTFAVQYWMGQRGWIKGGAGFGTFNDDFGTESGLAVMGGAGVELVQKRKFVLDLQGRVATTKFEFSRINMFMLSLGFNWY